MINFSDDIPIKFTDFMPVDEPAVTKVKFNIRDGIGGAAAWDLMMDADSDAWMNMNKHREKHQNNNLDRAEWLLSFAQYYPYGPQYFIFGGFFRVEPIHPAVLGGPGYELVPQQKYAEYVKRLIIKLENPVGRDLYLRLYEKLQDSKLNPEVYEVSADTKLGSFPGYSNVRLRHQELQRIINNDEPSWRDALSSVKGVYVITDMSNGSLYVGSASGDSGGIWQRWSSYAQPSNLTGGNKEIERIRSKYGPDHITDNFQYSILEIFDPKAQTATVLQRESFWKLALDSRKHGMNAN